jgi:hypothetical protein
MNNRSFKNEREQILRRLDIRRMITSIAGTRKSCKKKEVSSAISDARELQVVLCKDWHKYELCLEAPKCLL